MRKSGEITDVELTQSGAGWVAPSEAAVGSGRKIALSMLAMLVLGAAAWWGSGRYWADESRQQVAEAWDALRVCLLGEAIPSQTRPSTRMRFIALAVAHTEEEGVWPARCAPYAEALDEALSSRSMQRQFGGLPSAAAALSDSDGEALDLLYGELELADLPLPKRAVSVLPAPEPSLPMLSKKELASMGQIVDLAGIDAALDGDDGHVLRLLLPEASPLICRFNDGPRDQRWQTMACRNTPMTIERDARLRLTRSEPGAPDMIYARDTSEADGFYDASTGQRLWRPRYFDAQAVVRGDGASTILYADMRDGKSRERVDQFRVMTMVPGKRPKRRRLRIPSDARAMLFPGQLLWWHPKDGKDVAYLAPLSGGKIGKRHKIGELAAGTRPVADCAGEEMRAVLLVSGIRERRYAMVFMRDDKTLVSDIGVIEGKLSLSCHGNHAMLTRLSKKRAARWRCAADKCVRGLSSPLPLVTGSLAALAPLGDQVVLAWAAPREPLRLRIGDPDDLQDTPDAIVLDDELHDGIEPVAMDMISADGLAVLLIHDAGNRVFALRIDQDGPSPVRIVR